MQHTSVQLKQFLVAFSVVCKHCHHFLLLTNILHLQLQNYKVQKPAADGPLDHSQLLADKVKPQLTKSLMEINKEQVIAYFKRSISLKVCSIEKSQKLCVFILWYKTITFLCDFTVLFSLVFLFHCLYFWQWLQSSKCILTVVSLIHLYTLSSNSGKAHPRKFYE